MALNRIQAARLLSTREMALFESSLSDKAAGLDDKELGVRLRQLRTQRDKYQDLWRRQRVATRERTGTKEGPGGHANERTRQKAAAFAEAMQRLEKVQQRRQAAQARVQRKSGARRGSASKAPFNRTSRALAEQLGSDAASGAGSAKGPAKASRRSSKAPAEVPGSAKGAGPATQAAPSVGHLKRAQAMGQQRQLAHVSSRGRRDQAKRDSR